MTHFRLYSFSVAVLILCSFTQFTWAEVEASTSLKTYYAAADGKSDNALRLALESIISGHNDIGYKQLGTIMQWSDTKDADGVHVIDIYTNCDYTCNGAVTWISSGNVGDGMNREHTVPQSWFNKETPMVSDAFHIYPTDAKANNNRSSFLYGECPNGTSSSTKKCAETGKLGDSNWKAGTTSYTYNEQTYVASTSYSGTVYEPLDEYKGDLARGYFYMATRYASGNGNENCSNWTGGAFGNDNNGLEAYTAELMLKWHRLDPVSEKELIRNEVIYGNTTYNKSTKKQGNRNPFIDYPELVEHIWGDKKDVPVVISALETLYKVEDDPGEGFENVNGSHAAYKQLINGHLYIQTTDGLFTITGQKVYDF